MSQWRGECQQRPHREVLHTVSGMAAAKGVCVLYGYACQWDFASEQEMEIRMRGWEASAEVAISLDTEDIRGAEIWLLELSGIQTSSWSNHKVLR